MRNSVMCYDKFHAKINMSKINKINAVFITNVIFIM